MLSGSSILHSQSFEGLGMELGAGHNQLFWKAESKQADRTRFSLTYNFKCIYNIDTVKDLSIVPFIGYNRFGGISAEEPNGYKDKYWIDAIDGGFFLLYGYDNIRLGTGLKYSRHLKATTCAYGRIVDPPDTQRSWEEYDVMYFFKKYSYSISLRADYNLNNHVFIIFESWFGLNNFAHRDLDNILTIKQNHYRLLVGFVL